MEINVYEAKTHLSKLLKRVLAGEEVIISMAGTPVARLVRYEKPKRTRRSGIAAGLFEIPEDFDAPLPDDLQAEFES